MSYSDKLAVSMYQFRRSQKNMEKCSNKCNPKDYGMMILNKKRRAK